jgi:hypothetical protein
MLASGRSQPDLIFVNDTENDAFSDVAGLDRRCDEHYDNNWHDQQAISPG